MAMPGRQHWVIPIANKIGFNPSAKQASRINCLAASFMPRRHSGEPPSATLFSTIDGDQFNDEFIGDLHAAIRQVMSEAKPRRLSSASPPRPRIITLDIIKDAE
jgi:hypothetical protein